MERSAGLCLPLAYPSNRKSGMSDHSIGSCNEGPLSLGSGHRTLYRRSTVCSGVAGLKSLCKHLNFDGERCEYYYYTLNEWIIWYLFILKGKFSVISTEYGQLMWVAPRYSCGFGGLPS